MLFNLLWNSKPLFTVSTIFFFIYKNAHSKPQHWLQCLCLGPLWMRHSVLQKCSCLDLIREDVSNQMFSHKPTINYAICEFREIFWGNNRIFRYDRPFGEQTSHIPAFTLDCAEPRSRAAVFQINLFPYVAFPVSGGDMETWRPGCSPKLMNSWASHSPQIFMSTLVIYKTLLLAC